MALPDGATNHVTESPHCPQNSLGTGFAGMQTRSQEMPDRHGSVVPDPREE